MSIGTQNSRIEVNLGVVRNLLDDIAELIGGCKTLRVLNMFNLKKEISRDFAYISSRTYHEGLSFLTTQLPRLGKWYDGILSGTLGSPPVGFKPYRQVHSTDYEDYQVPIPAETTCPLFLRVFWHVIHDPAGSVLERARVIRAYRSLLYLFYKLEVPFTEAQLSAGLEKWKLIEEELVNFDYPDFYDQDMIQARDIINRLLSRWDPKTMSYAPDEDMFVKIHPQHGPGAVAGGESNESKWESFHMIRKLHNVYPWYEYLLGLRSSCRISPSMVSMIITFFKGRSEKEATSRLLFVPKDSRGPRVISCEPKELMFIQQGIARNMMNVLERRSHGRINFLDQTINGQLALASSESGLYATVDLEDASDRVSWLLVRMLFPDWAQRYLHATRSDSTLLPDGTIHKDHAKYAPMGSALCFPVESMIFWALSVVACCKAGFAEDVAKAATYVYGDDIITFPEAVPHLVELFSKVCLKVNVGKTYSSGPFRESCGVDAWKGEIITPLKIKKDICRWSLDGALATACCDYSSQCFALDYRKTGEYLYRLVDGQYPGILRVPDSPIGCLHVVDPLAYDLPQRLVDGYDRRMCKRWVQGWVVENPHRPCNLMGLSRLLKDLHGQWELYDPGKVVVPRATKIRKRKILVEGWPF